MALPTLADLKAQLNIDASDTSNDTELQTYLDAAVEVAENIAGPLTSRTVTETQPGGYATLVLNVAPVASLTSITPYNGSALTLTDMQQDLAAGIVRYANGYTWFPSNLTVVYTVGGTVTSAQRLAILIIAQHLWETQRGGTGLPALGDEPTTVVAGFAVPNRALELLSPTRRAPSVA